ncbi:MAG: bifunctional oligoribonuclease/PAP phosphatase NrnA [Nitrospirota bacterium]
MKVPDKILAFLKEEDNFLIATHVDPEPDALGSSVALSTGLERLGKNTILFDKDGVPDIYRFLPGSEKFRTAIPSSKDSFFSVILLDCNTPERAGVNGLDFRYSVVIDHHETEKEFGDIRWVEPRAAATGIMVYYLLKELGTEITDDIATNLYSAIAIDTGTFRYSNTTADVLRICADLIESGANPAFISQNLYETWSEQRFLLLCIALGTLQIRDSVAVIHATKEMFEKTRAKPEDTENFVSFPRMMKDVKVSVFLKELGENYWKVSLRSKGDINVATIATIFGGGGHKNAAGFEIKESLESAKETLLKKISQHLYSFRK